MQPKAHNVTSKQYDVFERREQAWKDVLLFSLLFLLISIGVYGVALLSGKSFIQFGDGFRQGYFTITECKRVVREIMDGGGLSLWSWSTGAGMDFQLGSLIDPFNLIAALFPMKSLELGFTIASMLKMYFGGLAFIFFLRTVNCESYKCIVGAVCYTFSTFFISVSLVQNVFLFNIYLFPMLVASVERIYQKKSPLLFIIVTAYYMARSIYFSYMAAIAVIIYIPIRFFAYTDSFEFKEFLANLGKFILYGLSGILLSAYASFETILSLGAASTSSTRDDAIGIFFKEYYYKIFGSKLLGRSLLTDYEDIGIPILAWILLPIAIRYFSKKKTNIIMTGLLFLALMSAAVCSMFNGFGYPSWRWVFIFIFFAVWTSIDVFDMDIISDKRNIILMLISLGVFSIWTIAFYKKGFISLSDAAQLYIPLQILSGSMIVIGAVILRYQQSLWKVFRIATLLAIIVSISLGWSYSFRLNGDVFFENGEIYTRLKRSAQRAGNKISDVGFYRIDQVDGVNMSQEMKIPVNENLYWQTRTLYLYNSKIPSKILEFNKLVGNNYGYNKRVFVLSNDNRMGLDLLYGVKYFLGSDFISNEDNGSSRYAGYGFETYEMIDDVEVLKNKYDIGIGFLYDKYINKDEFLKLSRLEREQALLQAAVISENQLPESVDVPKVSAEEIDTDIKDIPYEISASDGIVFYDGGFVAEKEDASFTISVKNIEKAQLILSFDGLLRGDGKSRQTKAFSIVCNNGIVRKMATSDNTNQSIPYVCDYDFNMGYHDNYSGEIKISFSKVGEYVFDRFYVSAMSSDNYDKYARICQDNRLRVSKFENERIEGSLDAKDDGVLFLSIPDYKNWHVQINGKEVEKISDVNIAFMGVPIEKGQNDVVIYYYSRGRTAGGIITILTAAGIAIIVIFQKFKKPKNS